MAQSKRDSNAIRNMLTHQGAIKPSSLPTPLRTVDRKSSQAAAIAARRADMGLVPTVSSTKKTSVQK
jgi:predicted deacylase